MITDTIDDNIDNIDAHLRIMMAESAIAKEVFIACMLTCAGVHNFNVDTMKDYELVCHSAPTLDGVKFSYRIEYNPIPRRIP